LVLNGLETKSGVVLKKILTFHAGKGLKKLTPFKVWKRLFNLF